MWVPLKSTSKHDELKTRPAAARGDSIKLKIDALHAGAEERAMGSLTEKAAAAAMHNQKASAVATGAKMADTLVFHERRLNVAMDEAVHHERAALEVKKRKAKGTREVNKVAAAIAALQDAQEDKAEAQAEAEAAAEERRLQHLGKVAAKGAAASEKVGKAAAKLQAETEAKAEAIDARIARAEISRCEAYYEKVTKEHAKHEAVLAKREAATTDALAKGASEAAREVDAMFKREAALEARAAKAALSAAKVEAAKAKVEAETAAKAAKLEGKLAAAAERKAAVTYPPCARAPKPSAIVPRKVGTLQKMARDLP